MRKYFSQLLEYFFLLLIMRRINKRKPIKEAVVGRGSPFHLPMKPDGRVPG